jgi:hypothetical protein
MRRAVPLFAILLALPALSLQAAEVERAPDLIDGSGLVNYMQRPTFKVGSWVKYRTTGSSVQGHKDDYTVTVIVAGEEVFWGEPCVWIETWTEKAGKRKATASLVSYSAFGDTMAAKHILWFLRKTINGFNEKGEPDMGVYTREWTELKLRRANWEQEKEKFVADTLGRDTSVAPAGTFNVLKVLRKQVHAETAEKGDSTLYYERRMNQTFHYSNQVPVTQLVKIETDDIQQGKTWLVGRFDSSPLNILERAQGVTAVVEFGTSGQTPVLVPEALRRPIDRKLVEEALSMPSEPPVRVLKRDAGR